MKTLIFSDSHLTSKFDLEWFDYIVNLVKSADQVIINGDFWDGYIVTFDDFCSSRWKYLFPLLKAKNTIYVFGNHDKPEFMDNRHSLFSVATCFEHKIKSGNKTLLIQHGHLIAPYYDSKKIFRNQNLTRPFYRTLLKIISTNNFFIKLQNNHEISDGFKKIEKFIKHARENYQKNHFHVFGHSHIHTIISDCNIISVGAFQKNSKHYLFIEDGRIIHES